MALLSSRHMMVAFSSAALMLVGSGCATKKHVRQTVAPVEARVTEAERQAREQASQIGQLENSVSAADERAMDAERKAREAGELATSAGTRADEARTVAENTKTIAESTRSRLREMAENIDNFQLVATENVLFRVNRYRLTDEAKQMLDDAVAKLGNSGNYILEIQGFADATGSATHNLELSRKRADSVVRYLTVQHNIPLRKINVLGLGEDDPTADNSTREGREQARRVEVKVFARQLGSEQTSSAASLNQ
jgi:outer membrane protein OmpA-like peptidoglycan-associated protein